jgi:ferritin-like protein
LLHDHARQFHRLDEEGLKEISGDERIEDSNHFEALAPRIYELGGALPWHIREFADVAAVRMRIYPPILSTPPGPIKGDKRHAIVPQALTLEY